MTKHHYVYKSYEEEGREYIGCRSCNCLPEEDIKYFGSFKDKTFKPTGKTIMFVCETRKEVLEIEIELHNFFDVAVNPKFANQSKQTSTGFDTTGVIAGPLTEEHKKKISVANSGEKHPMFNVPHTKEWKQTHSERMSGENNPQYGVPRTKEWKKTHSERMTGKYTGENNPCHGRTGEKHPNYGNTGALSPCSKAIIAIKPDGTQEHYGSISEASRKLKIPLSSLSGYLKTGDVRKQGKWEDWGFVYRNP